jgi:hypothetical protein
VWLGKILSSPLTFLFCHTHNIYPPPPSLSLSISQEANGIKGSATNRNQSKLVEITFSELAYDDKYPCSKCATDHRETRVEVL